MSIFIETTAREQHRVVHISRPTVANLVYMCAVESNTYLEHFHRLIYCRQDWDRATTLRHTAKCQTYRTQYTLLQQLVLSTAAHSTVVIPPD